MSAPDSGERAGLPAQPRLIRTVAAQLRVVHHTPGRLRLKLALTGSAELSSAVLAEILQVQQLLERRDGIRAVRLNRAALSCTIEYDPASHPPRSWDDLFAGVDSPAADRLAELLSSCTPPTPGG